ncbi:hypothetical protein ACFQ58_06220 [Agromyces sp. NPDC056523]|uniref:hypothetical protein n=1 Tax=Agromyces sp. NPDC056523 TaxID=3345850 RepID=UPI00366D2FD5
MQPEELERRRLLLHRLISLLPRTERRPVASVAAEGSGSSGTWTYYPSPHGGYGIGQNPDHGFIEEARVPDIPAVMDWVWHDIARDFIRRHVLSADGVRHAIMPVLMPLMTPRSERAAAQAAIDARAEALGSIADSGSRWARAAVASRADAEPELLASIGREVAGGSWGFFRSTVDQDTPDGIALRNVLTNPATPPQVLARFANSRSSAELWITQAVASNPATPSDVFARLARHSEPPIRWTVAGNDATPASASDYLAADADAVTRWFLARHHPVAPRVLGAWISDPSVVTCAAAGPNAGALASAEITLDPDVRLAVARNRAAPAELLNAWTETVAPGDERLAFALAVNPSTPIEGCRRLIDVVGTGTIATALLRRADLDPDLMDVVLAADRSWAVPDPRLAALPRPEPELPDAIRARLVADDDDRLRAFVARSSRLGPDVVERLINDPAATVRLALAGNRSIPAIRLEPLAEDADAAVAREARRRLGR